MKKKKEINERETTNCKSRTVKLGNPLGSVELSSSYEGESMKILVGNAVELLKMISPTNPIKIIPTYIR